MTSSSATPVELDVEHRLVVYGTLAPGEPNEHVWRISPADGRPPLFAARASTQAGAQRSDTRG